MKAKMIGLFLILAGVQLRLRTTSRIDCNIHDKHTRTTGSHQPFQTKVELDGRQECRFFKCPVQ